MKYVGFVIDRSIWKDHLVPCEKILQNVRILNTVGTMELTPVKKDVRIYSDEVTLCRGVQAFCQMERVFKSKYPGKWAAWRAWRRLV